MSGQDTQSEFANINDGDEQAENEGADSAAQDVIVALQAENSDLKDRILRAVAEMENLRKRTQREVSDARSYAVADFARDMLGATDNLARALAMVPEHLLHNEDPAIKSLIEGIEMTEREMQRLMQKHGVRPIVAQGQKFDPHKHQAMFEVPDETVPAGTVVQVVQTGYEIGERVLRPAMVGISKGGPKIAPKSNDTTGLDESAPDIADNAPDGEQSEGIDRQV
ncbi:Heat shock protein GrpE [hydrothermal vent metagenome]|uniref:Heat shock protein GrpE n=1 Tax=hydrothermal vent metagenome TaxID=652676 RepID=A0A3B0U7L3_9ZZZZ